VPDATPVCCVSWEFFLQPLNKRRTRLILRGRISLHWLVATTQDDLTARCGKIFIERIYRLMETTPQPIMMAIAIIGQAIMQARQLHGIKQRAEA
jgi:hypothetical protein